MLFEYSDARMRAYVPGTLDKEAGSPPIGFALGTKSNKGARRGATPYCKAMSRPRSSGILETKNKKVSN